MGVLKISERKSKRSKRKKIALFVDLESARDLQTILKIHDLARTYGTIIYSCLYAEEKDLTLISTMSSDLERKGFDIKVTIGPNEITMSLDLVEMAYRGDADILIACTRKTTLMPAFVEIKRRKKTLIIVAPISAPSALEEVADEIKVV